MHCSLAPRERKTYDYMPCVRRETSAVQVMGIDYMGTQQRSSREGDDDGEQADERVEGGSECAAADEVAGTPLPVLYGRRVATIRQDVNGDVSRFGGVIDTGVVT